jgi:DNA-binding response OmpR family regulator
MFTAYFRKRGELLTQRKCPCRKSAVIATESFCLSTAMNVTAPLKTPLLIVDDDRLFCGMLADYLDPFGYTLKAVHAGPAGVDAVRDQRWSAVILDVMLPGMDGFEVLRRIRTFSPLPVLMLTGRGDEMDRIVGLEVGADDYVPKTISMRELLARVRALLRRSMLRPPADNPAHEPDLEIGDLGIRPASRVATVGGQVVSLRPVEFDLLVSLARAKGRVLTRDQLLDRIRDRNWEAFDRSIDVHICNLRRKLGDDPRQPRYIRTCRSTGYLLIDPDAPR